jgi:hypothetical protein
MPEKREQNINALGFGLMAVVTFGAFFYFFGRTPTKRRRFI